MFDHKISVIAKLWQYDLESSWAFSYYETCLSTILHTR